MIQMRNLSLVLLFMLFLVSAANATYLTKDSYWDFNITSALWTSIAVGDVNNDGFNDFVQIGCTDLTSNYCSRYLAKIYINNGTSFIENSARESNLTGVNYGSIALGDIDNDGDLDLALSGCINRGGSTSACPNAEDRFSAIYVNNGTSFVENSTWKGDIVNTWKSSFAFGDIDLDGKLDIVLSGSTGVGLISKVYLNNGSAFKENISWEQELTGVYGSSTTLVDVDNDGKLDLFLVGDSGSGYIAKAYINNGTSFIENSTWEQNLLGVELASTVWGDFDNNGKMDFSLIGHTSSDEHSIYNNTGSGLVQINRHDPYGTLIGIFEGTQTLGDYNNDGKLDLFTSGEEQWSTLYLNTSAYYFEDPESQIFNTAYGPAATWVDVNNDYALDLILIGWDKDINEFNSSVYINNITVKNTAPSPPATLAANYSNGVLNLSWNTGNDAETPSAGLYYNLRVGSTPGGNQIVSGVYGGGDDNGYFGNMMQRKNILLNVNLSGINAIYWSVQTIDTGLKAGAWATERVYNISGQQGSSQNQTNDTTAPNVTITSPANGSTLTLSSVGVSASYADNSSVICTARLDSGSSAAMSLVGGTATHTFSDVTNGQHTIYVNCTDAYNNSAVRNSTFTVNVVATTNNPGGGNTGGSGGAAAVSNTSKTNGTRANQTASPLNQIGPNVIIPGETKTIEFSDTAVRQLSIEVQSTVRNIEIRTQMVEKPATIETPSGDVYSYIEIKHMNITDSDIKAARLDFSVEKSWLLENDINGSTVRLNRYRDGWQELDTSPTGENSTHYQYEAMTPGFSIFAITGEKNMEVTIAPPDNRNYYLPASIFIIAFAIVGGYFYYRHTKKNRTASATIIKST